MVALIRASSASLTLCAASVFAAMHTGYASASVTLYQGLDNFQSWSTAAGAFTTIDFTGFPQNTFVTDQYVDQGLLFTSSDPDVILFGPSAFPIDGVGLNGVHVVDMHFLAPTFAFAYHHPGKHALYLYAGDTLVYSSPAMGGSGVQFFDGVVSTIAFDRVKLIPWSNPDAVVYIDNLYFSNVPAPAGVLILILGRLAMIGRRRRAAA